MDLTTLEPSKMIETSNNGQKVNDELKASLSGMQNAQDELYVAVKGQTGNAIYQSFTRAYEKGTDLHASLQRIIEELRAAGVSFDATDQDTAAEYHKLDIDGGGSLVSDAQAASAAHNLKLDNWNQ